MKLLVEGVGEVALSQRDFLAQGGEASVYVRGDTAYKVYLDPKRALTRGKYQELSPLAAKAPEVVVPERLLIDQGSGEIRGYTMRFLRGKWILCQVFPRAFRDRQGLTPAWAKAFATRLRSTLLRIHECGVLVVDLNEMNVLVSGAAGDLALLDADSFQTRSFPATALMESVRDRHAKNFSKGTDWFAFAVVTFQAFCGIHPYKGTHPTVRGLDARMAGNLSVFRKEVRIPPAAYAVDVIPKGWRTWYKAVFEDILREPPPEQMEWTPPPTPPTSRPTAAPIQGLTMRSIAAFNEPIEEVWERGGKLAVLTRFWLYVDGRASPSPKDVRAVGFVPATGEAVMLTADGVHRTAVQETSAIGVIVGPAMSHDGVLYTQSFDRILTLGLHDRHDKLLVTTTVALDCLPHATKLYPGVVIQDLLGSKHASFFPRPGVVHQARLELEGYTVLDAKYDRGVLIVIAAKSGRIDRFIFRFGADPMTRSLEIIEDVGTQATANFAALDNDVAVLLDEHDRLQAFHRTPSPRLKVLTVDPKGALGPAPRLLRVGGKLAAIRGHELIQVETTT